MTNKITFDYTDRCPVCSSSERKFRLTVYITPKGIGVKCNNLWHGHDFVWEGPEPVGATVPEVRTRLIEAIEHFLEHIDYTIKLRIISTAIKLPFDARGTEGGNQTVAEEQLNNPFNTLFSTPWGIGGWEQDFR